MNKYFLNKVLNTTESYIISFRKDDKKFTKIYNRYCQFHTWPSSDDTIKFYGSLYKYSHATKLKVLDNIKIP